MCFIYFYILYDILYNFLHFNFNFLNIFIVLYINNILNILNNQDMSSSFQIIISKCDTMLPFGSDN
jgi:hypothetical protein